MIRNKDLAGRSRLRIGLVVVDSACRAVGPAQAELLRGSQVETRQETLRRGITMEGEVPTKLSGTRLIT